MSQDVVRAMPVQELAAERERLVRLCARLTGDAAVAEDLVQEALFEAWRSADNLRDPRLRHAWLSGIARNVCHRWRRSRGQESSRTARTGDESAPDPADWVADDLNVELEMERDELATLLDRALGLLPPDTRLALVQRYIEDAPQALIAERLGLSEGAVAMRLSRGKLSLRRILAGELREDAAAFGLFSAGHTTWEPTRIWCTVCGVQRLVGWFDPVNGTLMLRCPECYPVYGLHQARSERQPRVYAGVQGVKAAYRRLLVDSNAYHRRAFAENRADCPDCGGPATVHRCLPESELPRLRESRGAHVHCTVCYSTFHTSLGGLILELPAGRMFWQQHGQIRTLPEREIEHEGRRAVINHLESVTGGAYLDVISDIETLAILGVYANGLLQKPT